MIKVEEVMSKGALVDVCEFWCEYVYNWMDKYYIFRIDPITSKFLHIENKKGQTITFSKAFSRFLKKLGVKSPQDYDKKFKKWNKWRKKVERTGKRRLDSEQVHLTK